jgi:hypothetical protein
VRLDTLQVVLDTSAGANSAHIVVTGVDKANLNALRKAGWPNGKWTQLSVMKARTDSIPWPAATL